MKGLVGVWKVEAAARLGDGPCGGRQLVGLVGGGGGGGDEAGPCRWLRPARLGSGLLAKSRGREAASAQSTRAPLTYSLLVTLYLVYLGVIVHLAGMLLSGRELRRTLSGCPDGRGMAPREAAESMRATPLTPRSSGCGPRQRILSCCHALITGLGNTHSVTDKQMIVLDTMDLEARDIVHRAVHEHQWLKEGKHHGCRGRGSQTFVAGNVSLMLAEIEAHLPLTRHTPVTPRP